MYAALLDELPDHPPPVTRPLAERKQVTVLFCDVESSMALAGSLGPEAWRSIMARFFELFRVEIERFGGTVDKFTGDGAMALFGAPVAHEDHAVRACHAALALRGRVFRLASQLEAEHEIAFEVRTGLNSGEVVVGSVDDSAGGYTAIGTAVGLASRMEALAAPGETCLTEHTARLVRTRFELGDMGEVEVKGMHFPIRAYSLLGEVSAGSRGWAASAPLVARSAEMAALEEVTVAIRELLHGREVTTAGKHVHLDAGHRRPVHQRQRLADPGKRRRADLR